MSRQTSRLIGPPPGGVFTRPPPSAPRVQLEPSPFTFWRLLDFRNEIGPTGGFVGDGTDLQFPTQHQLLNVMFHTARAGGAAGTVRSPDFQVKILDQEKQIIKRPIGPTDAGSGFLLSLPPDTTRTEILKFTEPGDEPPVIPARGFLRPTWGIPVTAAGETISVILNIKAKPTNER